MTIKAIKRNSFKIFAVLMAIALAVSVGVFARQSETVSAAGATIDVSTDLTADNSGTGWQYTAATNTIELTDDGVIITGTKTDATSVLNINGANYTVTFSNLNYAASGANYAIYSTTGFKINLVGNNSLSLSAPTGWPAVLASAVDLTIGGSGSLNVGYTGASVSAQAVYGIRTSNSMYITGGNINVVAADNTGNSSLGIAAATARAGTLSITGGTISTTGGSSAANSAGLYTNYYNNNGVISITGGDVTAMNSESSAISAISRESNPATAFAALPSGYSWSASVNANGSSPTTGSYPGTAFTNSASYHYINIIKTNTPPTVSISSPAAGSWFQTLSGVNVAGTITDPDDDTWQLAVGASLTTTPPNTWGTCGSTTDRSFSCSSNTLDVAEGDWYFFVRVNDGSGWVYNYVPVHVDNTAPTAPALTFSNSYVSNTWTNSTQGINVTVNNGTDTGSGVNKSTYQLSGAVIVAETDYISPITVADEGVTVVRAWTIDNVGYNSSSAVGYVNIDRTLPAIAHSASGGTHISGNTYTDPPTIELDATDPTNTSNDTSGSGISTIEYSWEIGSVNAASCALGTTVTGQNAQTTAPNSLGDHTLCYRTTDKAGNTSAVQVITYTITNFFPTLNDGTTGITVEHLGGGFTHDQYLVIDEIDPASRNLSESDQYILAVYDIKVCSTNDNLCVPITSWNDNLRISVPLSGITDEYTDVSLYFLSGGTSTVHSSTIANDVLTFETDHLSEWAIAGSLALTGPVGIVPGAPNTGAGNLLTRSTDLSFCKETYSIDLRFNDKC